MLLVASPGFASSKKGVALRQELLASKGATVVSPLPDAKPRVVIPARPAGDTRVTVTLVTAAADRLVADAEVGGGSFGFSSLMSPDGAQVEHCFENPPCPYRCVTCAGPDFTCCGPPNCDIGCRHFNCDTR
ncbi:MAG: hypothetical protein ACM3O7_08175 [Acidobacteriota bacterium]